MKSYTLLFKSKEQKMDTIIEEIANELVMNDASISNILQKYIPVILKNDLYVRKFSAHIFTQYNFEVNAEHLRKKLNIYLKESFRTNAITQAQRLIKGEYRLFNSDKKTWIWLSSKDVGLIAQKIVEGQLDESV